HVWDVKTGMKIMTVPWKDGLDAAMLTPDASRLAIATQTSIELWDVEKKKLLRVFKHENETHLQGALSIDFSSDGAKLATGGYDLTTRVWDLETGKEIVRLPHSDMLMQVKFLSDDSMLITRDFSKVVRAWHIPTGTVRFQLSHGGSIDKIVHAENSKYVLTANGAIVHVWNTSTGQKIAQFKHDNSVTSMALSPDGKQLVSVSSDGSGISLGKIAQVWDVDSQEEIFQLIHDGGINDVSFSADNHRVLTGSRDKTARLWNSQTGKEIIRLTHNDEVGQAKFSNDGARIAAVVEYSSSSPQETHVWDVASKRLLARIQGIQDELAFSPDSHLLAMTNWSSKMRIIDPASAQREHLKIALADWPSSMVLSPDGKRVAIIQSNQNLWMGRSTTGKYKEDAVIILDLSETQRMIKIPHLHAVYAIAFSPDGSRVITAGADEAAKVWDANTGKELYRLEHDEGDFIRWAKYSPDGSLIATKRSRPGSFGSGSVQIWNPRFKQPIQLDEKGIVNVVVFSPDSTRLVTAEGDYEDVRNERGMPDRGDPIGFFGARLWNTVTGKELMRLPHDKPVQNALFNSDGTVLATDMSLKRGDAVLLWDTTTGERLARFQVSAKGQVVNLKTFSPDGRYLAANAYNTLLIWDSETRQEIVRLNHKDGINDIVFTHDGQYIAVANGSNISVWDWQHGRELARLQHDNDVYNIDFTPDDNKLVTATASHINPAVYVWEWRETELVKDACARLERNLTKQEWGLYMGNIKYRPTCPDIPDVN
ncbi:MAG: WD40 repeat domain-containing protein, partial [Thiotrichaceae bacterium]